jgi:hypothetical protein
MSEVKEAAKAALPEKGKERRFFEDIRKLDYRARAIATMDYFHAALGLEVPRRPVLFTYGYYSNDGTDTSMTRKSSSVQRSDIPPGVNVDWRAVSSKHDSGKYHQIEGEYNLVIHGVTIPYQWGRDDTPKFNPLTNSEEATVKPEPQNFEHRQRIIAPSEDLAFYAFVWLHPRNFDSPSNLSQDVQRKHGLSVQKTQRFQRPSGGPRIKANINLGLVEKSVFEARDEANMMKAIAEQSEATLRNWAIKVDGRFTGYGDLPMRDIYVKILRDVIFDKTGTPSANERRATLKAAIAGGDDHTSGIVNDAIKLGALVLDTEGGVNEWHLARLDGGQDQPGALPKYRVPHAQVADAAGWLSNQLSIYQEEKTLVLIQDRCREFRERAQAGKVEFADHDRVVNDLIAQGKIVFNNGKGAFKWELVSEGKEPQMLCGGGKFGADYDSTYAKLLEWAHKREFDKLCLELGVFDDDVE